MHACQNLSSLNKEILPSVNKNNTTPIIALHGWARNLLDLKPLAELIQSQNEIHLIDLPGFGKSEPPPESGWGTAEYAEKILEYINSLEVNNVILLGHSFGGRISLRIAASHPELVKQIILIDSHGLRPVRSLYQNIRIALIKKLAKLVKFIDRSFGTKLYIEKYAKRFGSPDYQRAGVLKNTFVKTISENQTESIKTIKTPTLLLWGELDTETPVAMARRFNVLLENSKLIILPGKDHNPHQGMGAHLCANYIMEFLGD